MKLRFVLYFIIATLTAILAFPFGIFSQHAVACALISKGNNSLEWILSYDNYMMFLVFPLLFPCFGCLGILFVDLFFRQRQKTIKQNLIPYFIGVLGMTIAEGMRFFVIESPSLPTTLFFLRGDYTSLACFAVWCSLLCCGGRFIVEDAKRGRSS